MQPAFSTMLATGSLLFALQGSAAEVAGNLNRSAAVLSITAADARQHVNALADDTFEGREAGSRGGRAAGIYLVKQLQRFGLRGGAPGGSFYQKFDTGTNILALVEGSEPELRKQVIVVSGHYDHVGYGTRRNSYGPIGLIHNGADDNASGVAGLLEVVEAVSQLDVPPKRSILFALWDGEEKGLLGSKHWIANPTVPLAQVPIAINTDMIGRLRNGRLEVVGSRTSTGLRRLVSLANDDSAVSLDFNWEMKANSDHHTFFAHKIPVLMFHTGLHGDYHRPSDDADKINAEGLQHVAQLMFKVLIDLANAPRLAPFRAASQLESPGTQREAERPLPLPPGRLGVWWKKNPATPHAIEVERVNPQSAAARGGVRPGDRLVKFAGHELASADELRELALAAENPVPIVVERPGATNPVSLTLQLTGEPVRVGVSWHEDAAEPGVVMLNRVIPGSPADRAGLKLYDRIYQVGGQDFVGGEDFRRLITTLARPTDLLVESRGQTRRVTLASPAFASQNR